MDADGIRAAHPRPGALVHITGLIGHIAAAFITASPLVLAFRFEPGVMLDAIAEHRPAFAIGAITAFIALMNHPDAHRESLAILRTVYSGGAEIVVDGPMVVPGYWHKPEETASAMRADGFRTGDVGFMDAAGWFYLVDRKKDVIIASGYKVWPREVEDVLYAHPAVREAAMVGVKDAYRGETVKAVISLKGGEQVTPEAIVEHCRTRMAAYKYPRLVEIVEDLPKTPTGKILRRGLRS